MIVRTTDAPMLPCYSVTNRRIATLKNASAFEPKRLNVFIQTPKRFK